MGKVNIKINGQTYAMACKDGDEDRLSELGVKVDEKVSQLSKTMGSAGERRLLLMAALLLADEAEDAQQKAKQAEDALATGGETEDLSKLMKQLQSSSVILDNMTKQLSS